MKTRLLMLLSVFMAITSVGWMQSSIYYLLQDWEWIRRYRNRTRSYCENIVGRNLGDANAKTESDSIVVSLSNGDYTAASGTFPITKSGISIIGTDSNKVVIKSPFDITLSEKGNISFSSLQIAATTATGRGLVDIKSSNTTVSFLDVKLNIEGGWYCRWWLYDLFWYRFPT